eukprot:TRINITY_DN8243_c0_g1_i8.p1 TRINITY_DN8243_c0_g1~~TRINITY_DN8243_c0_g1_i8.p1  ORF type:complete len:135 (-),score=16.87 TRINITY_DN8243_c0_g1_i8:391-795(-)
MINDERMVLCYDVLAMLCSFVLERIPFLQKTRKEIPPDMYMTLHTLIYAGSRSGIDELMTARRQLSTLCGKEFVKKSETDEMCVNEIIRENINIVMPEEGWKVERLMQLAKDEGIQYSPTEMSNQVLQASPIGL